MTPERVDHFAVERLAGAHRAAQVQAEPLQVVHLGHEAVLGGRAAQHVDAVLFKKVQIFFRLEPTMVGKTGRARSECGDKWAPQPFGPSGAGRGPHDVGLADVEPQLRRNGAVGIGPSVGMHDAFGFPVVPEVYSRNARSSRCVFSISKSTGWPATTSS